MSTNILNELEKLAVKAKKDPSVKVEVAFLQ